MLVARHTDHKLAIGGTPQVLIISIHDCTPTQLETVHSPNAPEQETFQNSFKCQRIG
jgi:hypothetical protein